MNRLAFKSLSFFAVLSFLGQSAFAFSFNFPFDVSLYPNIGNLISPTVADGFVSSVGYAFDFRPYQPATPLGSSIGLDLGVEATALKVTDDLKNALNSLGALGSADIPVIPAARIILIKGFGENGEFGVSAIWVQSDLWTWGLTGKIAIYKPEEGATWALRLNYSHAKISFVTANIWTPEVLVSRRMEFADPYVGIGYQFIYGDIDATITGTGTSSTNYQAKGKGSSFKAFLGLALRMPELGLKLTLEGAFHLKQSHSLGAKIGFEF